ncbi:hypothetical protein J2Y03_000699 [Neobacillus niacini]|nr:hypothetical protein [Neobacillus niacini]MDR7075711.1 hypothetical protein [Neobacillus niacini]
MRSWFVTTVGDPEEALEFALNQLGSRETWGKLVVETKGVNR